MPDSIISQPVTTTRRPKRNRPLMSAAQMRAYWENLQHAKANYSEDDEHRTGKVYSAALDLIADARTVEPTGIALKLRAVLPYSNEAQLDADLSSSDTTRRTIASIIRDLETEGPQPPTANVSKATGSDRALAALNECRETLREVETDGRAQQFNIGYAVELLELLANDSGEASRQGTDDAPIDSLDMQGRWLRVEYLARQIATHVVELTKALDGLELLQGTIYRAVET